ncbi:MAG: DUF3667 domain-containing protein [Pseudobacteriovorax sp.]|nr:DUF3667 domain-containing protein [Pseudobacteriovorax sp.]
MSEGSIPPASSDSYETRPNCGQQRMGNYCHHCGQSKKLSSRSMRALIGDFIDTYFSVDGKLFRSTIKLMFFPGFLTNAYLRGERFKYLHPFRIYLFISLIFFLFSNQFMGRAAVQADSDEILSMMEVSEGDKDKKKVVNLPFLSESTNKKLSELATESTKKILADIHQGRINLVVGRFYQNIPKAFVFLLPLYALLLYLLLFMRRPYFVDHFIFSLHIHSFFFLAFMLIVIIDKFLSSWAALPLLLWMCYYPFSAIKSFGDISTKTSALVGSIITLVYLPLAFLSTLIFVFATTLVEYQ